MDSKKWFRNFIILLLVLFALAGGLVAFVDPFFHYRKPRDYFYYTLYEQRSQNDGITKHFDYDSIITGTSMAENFRPSIFDEEMGTNSIKVTYAGATYKEINDNLKVAYNTGHEIRYVFRPLDYSLLVRDKDELRLDLGEYPDYLTNKNPFDDVEYYLNKEVIVRYTMPVILRWMRGEPGGYTSFDEYSYNGDKNVYSIDQVRDSIVNVRYSDTENEATDEELKMLEENVEQNVVSLARQHPETTYIYFFPPYSMAYWQITKDEGNLGKQIVFVKNAVEQMLECDNIHIYNFALAEEITGNLDNYMDVAHYSPAINDYIEKELAAEEKSGEVGEFRLTGENYEEYFKELTKFLYEYDYSSLFN